MKSRWPLKKMMLFWILPMVVLSAILTFFRPFWYVELVRKTAWNNGVLYGVDEWNGKLRLFGCDAEGHNTWMDTIYDSKDADSTFYSVFDIEILEDGICSLLLKPQEVTDINNFLYIQYDLDKKQIISTETVGNNVKADVYIKEKLPDGIWTVRTDGSVWISGGNGEELIFSNDGKQVSANNTVYAFGNEGLYFYNKDADKCYVIDYIDKKLSEAVDIPFHAPISSYGSLYSLDQAEDGTWTAVFYTPEDQLSPMVVGQSQDVLVRLMSPPIRALKSIIITSFMLIIGSLLLKLIIDKIRSTFPTALKIICFSIPLLLVCCAIIQAYVQNFLKDDVVSRFYTQMYYTADSLNKRTDLKSKLAARDNVDYHNILYAQNMITSIYDANGKILQNMENIVGSVMIFGHGENDSFYSLNAGSLTCESTALYGYSGEREVLQKVLDTATTVKASNNFYDLGECLTLYYPIVQDQQVVGIVRVVYPENNAWNEIMDNLVEVIKNIFAFLLAMIIFLTIVCFLLLRPLNKIKRALSDFSVGIDLEESAKDGKRTEIKEMTNLFHHMIVNIREHLQHIDLLERAYEPYIPQSLVNLFGKEDIKDISPEDETVVEDAAILIMDAQDFSKAVSKAGTQEMFQFLNRVLVILTASVEDADGIVIQFTDTGLCAFFESNPDQALQAAITAQKDLQSLSLTLAGEQIYFGTAISCGDIRIGIIGTEERMEVRAVSPQITFAQSLQRMSSIYHLGVLIDEDTLERLDLQKDNTRLLGFVKDAEQQIYEVFDGLKSEVIALNQITKEDFEAGVRYFEAGTYTTAKDCFIRVLRRNKDDLAAARYLMLCSNQLERKEKGRNVFE